MLAGISCFALAMACFTVITVVVRRLDPPSTEQVATVPDWAWLGGALGAGVVLA